MPTLLRKASWNSLTTCSLQVGYHSNFFAHSTFVFLKSCNCSTLIMLSIGIVPALFPDDEKESVLNQLRDEALKMGAGPSKESVWQYFVNKSTNNLHIVLGMSPVGDTLRTRCRNFPGEIRCQAALDCNIISDFILPTVCTFFLRTDEQHCDRLVSAMASTGVTCSGSVFPRCVITHISILHLLWKSLFSNIHLKTIFTLFSCDQTYSRSIIPKNRFFFSRNSQSFVYTFFLQGKVQ